VPKVLVIDDGSTDNGGQCLSDLPLAVIRHTKNQGKGAAILTAAQFAREHGYTHILTLDADGQHDPADIGTMLQVLKDDPRAIVVGKRDFDQESIPGGSRFGRSFSNFWLRLQTGKSLGDTQSGFRIYPLYVLEGLNLWTSRYNFEIEVLVRAAWAGVPLVDAPISVYYPPGNERVSHFRGFMDNWRLTLLNTHLTGRSIVPWPHRKLIESDEGEIKVSVFQPIRSLRLLLSENTSPQQLAAAAFVGVFLGALPIIFAHTIAILFAAGFLRLNKVAAVAASQLCMPPLVPALCIELGYYMRHGSWLTEFNLETLGYQGLQRLWEWLLGSLVLAPALGILVAGIVYLLALSLRREADVG
jgi:uncharacterized protein (DUF2062 family)